MKHIALFLTIFCSFNAFALSDIERGLLFMANSASGGTFLPGMEVEIERIKLEHEKKKASFQLQLEMNNQSHLRALLAEEISYLRELEDKAKNNLTMTTQEKKTFAVVLDLIGKLYTTKITLPELLAELQDRTETMNSLQGYWVDIVTKSMVSIENSSMSQEQVNILLLQALDRNSEFDRMKERIDFQLAMIRQDIKTFETQMAGLK